MSEIKVTQRLDTEYIGMQIEDTTSSSPCHNKNLGATKQEKMQNCDDN